MGKVMEYLVWRGDLDFIHDPFNDVDALILALLSYLPLKGVVPSVDSNAGISLKETAAQFFSKAQKDDTKSIETQPTISASFNSGLLVLLAQAAESPRFETVQLSKYEENTDFVVGRQFGALMYTLPVPKREKVVAFRGTDNSLIGWKEDFEIVCTEQTPAQESACRYLDDVIGLFSSKVTVCGHSKGGNLAVYASALSSPKNRGKIARIINFDGPGFDFSILPRAHFSNWEEKIRNFIPQESMVGMLLEPVGKRKVISSASWGINQHNALNWQVKRTHFVPATMSRTTKLLEDTLNTWLAELPLPKRKLFIDALFDVLGAADGRKIDPKEDIKEFKNILIKYSKLDRKTKLLLFEVFSSFNAKTRDTVTKTIRENLPRI